MALEDDKRQQCADTWWRTVSYLVRDGGGGKLHKLLERGNTLTCL